MTLPLEGKTILVVEDESLVAMLLETILEDMGCATLGPIATIDEALSKLWMIDRFGPSPQAFLFKQRFPAPGFGGGAIDMNPDPWCSGWA